MYYKTARPAAEWRSLRRLGVCVHCCNQCIADCVVGGKRFRLGWALTTMKCGRRHSTLGLARVAREQSRGEVAGRGIALLPANHEPSSIVECGANEAAVLPVKTHFDRRSRSSRSAPKRLLVTRVRRGVTVRMRQSHRRELRPMQ